jgi:hypothetical protein
MAPSRAHRLRRIAVLTSIISAAAIGVPRLRSMLARSFVQITHTAVHAERLNRDA